jgi:rhomboid protease GluP
MEMNMSRSNRNSILCPNCRKLISSDEPRCPHCGLNTPGARWRNTPLTRGWGSGEQLVRAIIYVNIGMYVISLLINPRGLGMGFNPLFMLSPSGTSLQVLGATGSMIVSPTSGWWTLISANYLHGSALHIFFNLMALNQISPLITQLYGPYRYFVLYTASGICGFLISYLAGVPFTIGASAALCGLIGASLYYGKSRGGVFGQTVYRQIGGWAIFILLAGFMIPGVNNWGHIGGMLGGALFGLLLGYHEKSRENQLHRILAGVCMAATVAVLLWSLLRGFVFLLR